ncbi:hypothetical protein AMELA_G00229490 [Ameiurus melas]|uniref:Uncharacterized protein n=1 Tax=Ameiurus melas TaxID=219545 RepID=A0A7J5ZX35_AMEME|nr:hypothetical protein AMELA_G00229490 [Ameiurus melas]
MPCKEECRSHVTEHSNSNQFFSSVQFVFVITDRKKSSDHTALRHISGCENCMMGNNMSGHGQEMPNPVSETAAGVVLSFTCTGTDLNMDHPAYFNILTNKRLQALITEFQHPDCHQWSIQRLEEF